MTYRIVKITLRKKKNNMENVQELENKLQNLLGQEFISLTFRKDITEKDFQREIYYIIGNDYEAEVGIKKSNGEVYNRDYIKLILYIARACVPLYHEIF